MSNAKKAIEKTLKEEGGFQADPKDSGNFLNGINYGTKYGITPAAWVNHFKKPIQTDTIKNLTIPEAVDIYKKRFWDKIRGDEIENYSVAALMMFTVVNSGIGQTKTFKRLMNQVAGKKIVAETSTPFTGAEIKLLNDLDQEKYFNALKAERERFYRAIAAADPNKARFLKGWLNRLNAYEYSPEKKNG